ncbi:hypothetical protein [Bacillus thuringiensis]|uniref:Uncharacterized protein n=1 Tax=Bacillus thuringiensis TaxID=1428 RepID=A0A1C4E9E6_BACTU|nr:hypothetical protein [Bacillus thuringiensis]MDY0855572.1 hypothetical protein [Bacillus thuringiensis]MDY4395385.1 hypothetical protein [Bacillus thuringiensis]MED1641510.1 hypothetical protein [Bacillus thuringiensis]SCC40266.1 Protein of unknown function [Bacillus thuringiensis]
MIFIKYKKSSSGEVEIDFQCDFEKIISLLLGTTTLLDYIAKALGIY